MISQHISTNSKNRLKDFLKNLNFTKNFYAYIFNFVKNLFFFHIEFCRVHFSNTEFCEMPENELHFTLDRHLNIKINMKNHYKDSKNGRRGSLQRY